MTSDLSSPRLAACWSGGKDSCYACFLTGSQGTEVTRLYHLDLGARAQHGIAADVIALQAEALGVECRSTCAAQGMTALAHHKRAMLECKAEGFAGMVFGDLGGSASRLDWFAQTAHEVGIPIHLPLYGVDHRVLLESLIKDGFTAVLVNANASLFGEEWIGRVLDLSFIDRLDQMAKQYPGLSHAGERGEYHSFVLDGPSFRERLHIEASQTVLHDAHWFLHIHACVLKEKAA